MIEKANAIVGRRRGACALNPVFSHVAFIRYSQGGPPQNVMLWRNFAALSRATEVANGEEHIEHKHQGSLEESPVRDSRELAQIEMQTFNIVLAFMESLEKGCQEVPLNPIEFEGECVNGNV